MIDHIPTAAISLGRPVAEYKARPFNTLGGPLIALVSVLLLILGCQLRGGFIWLAILALIGLPFGVLIGSYGLRQRGLRVLLFADGLSYEQAGRITVVLWRDIVTLNHHVTRNYINLLYAGTTHSYRIQLSNGTQLILDSKLQRVQELGTRIEEVVNQQQRAPTVKLVSQ